MNRDRREAAESLPLPQPRAWRQLGLRDATELSGGHQSRVFGARLGEHTSTGRVVAKLTDSRVVEPSQLEKRTRIVDEIASISDLAVAPLRLHDAFVNRLDDWLVVVSPFVEGPQPDVERRGDVELMGRTLAELHRAIATVATSDVPMVAALQVAPADAAQGPTQLLHGDFASANIRQADGVPRVLDFDDCGYGPVQFDVANSLYMELFDATINQKPAKYERFRRWFVDSYRATAGISVDEDVLERMIGLRRDALRHWIDHLPEAPIGIRSSSPEWVTTLRWFTEQAI